ncbi:MAG: class I tRNA ligase family protein [Colwellia sp.]|nr:class I tRNA ligase family protein [Colwellia sp.]
MGKSPTPPDFIVTLPPPTPNGGLHVGHMAGPFLAADIFTKAAQASGKTVHVLSYSDSNQSYVRATAEKQNRDPKELASFWTQDILETLDIYGCQVDNYFEPHPASDGFVRDTLLRLYEQGLLKKKSYPFFYLPEQGVFLDEAGASGHCPRCLDDCKCGICEACGFPTQADTLINPRATNDPSLEIELRHVEVLVLELEAWRGSLRRFHDFSDAIRPKYRWLVDDVLAGPLPDFPITVPGSWGIAADHPDLPNQVINAWPELVLDFVYGYQKVAPQGGPTPKIVNFFGYDNSYFYAIVHVALLHAAELQRFLPHATMVNEFYNLENAKFSTSRGHLIWARDMAQSYPPDLIRFYTALSSPGFEQGNFSETDMREVIQRRLLAPFQSIAAAAPVLDEAIEPSATVRQIMHGLSTRVAESYQLHRFNLRHAAEDALKGLNAIQTCLSKGDLSRGELVLLLDCWGQSIAPLMPAVATSLRHSLVMDIIPEALPFKPVKSQAPRRVEEANA